MRRSSRAGVHRVASSENDPTGPKTETSAVERPPSPPGLEPPRPVPLKASLTASPLPHARERIRILIADGDAMFRAGCRRLLESEPDFDILGDVGNGVDAVRLAFDLRPDVLLLDLSIPDLGALDVLRTFERSEVEVRCVLISGDVENATVVEILRLGGRGLLHRRTDGELLCKSIRKVAGGELWIGRDTLRDVVKALASAAEKASPVRRDFGLTRREREIVALVVEGDSNKAIARRLSVGEDTVKHHLTSIFNKTGVSSRLELALFALHSRLVDSTKL
jgi:two-component system, NarL family, nitrate/nitrite response regulator NarL